MAPILGPKICRRHPHVMKFIFSGDPPPPKWWFFPFWFPLRFLQDNPEKGTLQTATPMYVFYKDQARQGLRHMAIVGFLVGFGWLLVVG